MSSFQRSVQLFQFCIILPSFYQTFLVENFEDEMSEECFNHQHLVLHPQ